MYVGGRERGGESKESKREGKREGGSKLTGMWVPREQVVAEGVIIGSSASGVTGSCGPSERSAGNKTPSL